jgi:two-component system, NtrC family, sensor kinase
LISEQIDRIKQVTRDMTNFARSRPAARSHVDINAVIDVALRLANLDDRFQNLEIEKQLPPDLPPICGDEDQLQQVLLNLLLNARDAMPDGGNFCISSHLDGSSLMIEISDTGPGIEPTVAAQMFNPFFTTKPPGLGTGLGLAICEGIVTAHGGEIRAISEGGIGTTIRLSLPVSNDSAAADMGPAIDV